MWCKCVTLPSNNIACLNIPYSASFNESISIRVKVKDEYIDFSDSDIIDLFLIVKTLDDVNANEFTRLSISNGNVTIDTSDSQQVKIKSDSKMDKYIGGDLYYQMFIDIDNEKYPLLKGIFIKEKSFI